MATGDPRRVPFFAPGGTYFGAAVNGRWFESPPCRDKRCHEAGPHRHWFDVETGRMVTEPAVETGPIASAEPIRKAG
jgi:hypothetical protein